MDVEESQLYNSSLLSDKPNNDQGVKGRLVMGFCRAETQNTYSINLYKQQGHRKTFGCISLPAGLLYVLHMEHIFLSLYFSLFLSFFS